jgi:putative mRNA 3-end processing factor
LSRAVYVKQVEVGGVLVEVGGKKFALDSKAAIPASIYFYSHAHRDHLGTPAPNSKIVASRETVRLAKIQGVSLREAKEQDNIYRTGHVLGSTGILLEDSVYYTGDIAGRTRGFMPTATPVPCRVLIIEATYGKPKYRFPPITEVVDRANELIDAAFSQGVPVLLLGYPLGKCQLLTYFFSIWEPHLFISDDVERFNRAYRSFGVDLIKAPSLEGALGSGGLTKTPWLGIAPLSPYARRLKEVIRRTVGRPPLMVAFSGWGIDEGAAVRFGVDCVLPLSDHCDYEELLSYIKACNPEKVYTVHGYVHELAQRLREMGFDATPLGCHKEAGAVYILE